MSQSSSSSGGVGIAGLLTVAFVVLKLTHVIAWSWWWVLSPLWISFGLFLAFLAVAGVVALIVVTVSDRSDRKQRRRKSEIAASLREQRRRRSGIGF